MCLHPVNTEREKRWRLVKLREVAKEGALGFLEVRSFDGQIAAKRNFFASPSSHAF